MFSLSVFARVAGVDQEPRRGRKDGWTWSTTDGLGAGHGSSEAPSLVGVH